jgi:steroid delta-isomerase-like uncharacterized protein
MSIEENKTVMRRILTEIVNQGNLALAEELVAPDYVYRAPGSPEYHGPNGMRDLVSSYRSAFPDLQLEIQEMIAEGDKVVTHYTLRGTHQGNLEGIPPTGKQMVTPAIIISTFRDGKLIEEYEVIDTLDMLTQLGVSALAEEE